MDTGLPYYPLKCVIMFGIVVQLMFVCNTDIVYRRQWDSEDCDSGSDRPCLV